MSCVAILATRLSSALASTHETWVLRGYALGLAVLSESANENDSLTENEASPSIRSMHWEDGPQLAGKSQRLRCDEETDGWDCNPSCLDKRIRKEHEERAPPPLAHLEGCHFGGLVASSGANVTIQDNVLQRPPARVRFSVFVHSGAMVNTEVPVT